jgi:hypothetical protein
MLSAKSMTKNLLEAPNQVSQNEVFASKVGLQ